MDGEINEIVNRYNQGQSIAKISRELSRTEDTVKNHLVRLGIFRPRKINKNNEIKDNQSFVSKYLKIRLTFLSFILPIVIILMVIFPLLNPLENFLIILSQIFNWLRINPEFYNQSL